MTTATITKTNTAGWVINILGVQYAQEGYRATAQEMADKINARTADMTPAEVRALYKLGDRLPREDGLG